MIILDTEQGTPGWFAARAGRPTASNFAKVVTGTGNPSTQVKAYMFALIAETLATSPLESYSNRAMERGIELEQEAVDYYQFDREVDVQRVGLCYQNEERLWSCSPDGLVGMDGGLEIKCPSHPVHIEYLLAGTIPTKYKPQVQGSLWITGRDWWDFMSYHPGLPSLIVRVERDETYIARLSKAVSQLSDDLQENLQKIKEKYNV